MGPRWEGALPPHRISSLTQGKPSDRRAPGRTAAGVFDPQMLDPRGMTQAKPAHLRTLVVFGDGGFADDSVRAMRRPAKATEPTSVGDLLAKFFDPQAWFSGTDGMDQALQRMSEGPRRRRSCGTPSAKCSALFNAWAALRQRSLAHNAVMLEAWLQAAGKYARKLNRRADRRRCLAPGGKCSHSGSTRQTGRCSRRSVPKGISRAGEILKTSTDLRLAQQEVAAFYSEMFGYPTRQRSTTCIASVTELRRELRKLYSAQPGSAEADSTPKAPPDQQRTLVQLSPSHGE